MKNLKWHRNYRNENSECDYVDSQGLFRLSKFDGYDGVMWTVERNSDLIGYGIVDVTYYVKDAKIIAQMEYDELVENGRI